MRRSWKLLVDSAVVDASAILALLQAEPGGERVAALLLDPAQTVLVSALNWSEVLDRLLRHGSPVVEAERQMARLGMVVVDFDQEQGRLAAIYRMLTPSLSLADRACLAVATVRNATAWTADRAWMHSMHGVPVELIRG
jgi:PIN domain nuclease of toxin-antitoxin system